jgi:hypothetical protein
LYGLTGEPLLQSFFGNHVREGSSGALNPRIGYAGQPKIAACEKNIRRSETTLRVEKIYLLQGDAVEVGNDAKVVRCILEAGRDLARSIRLQGEIRPTPDAIGNQAQPGHWTAELEYQEFTARRRQPIEREGTVGVAEMEW